MGSTVNKLINKLVPTFVKVITFQYKPLFAGNINFTVFF